MLSLSKRSRSLCLGLMLTACSKGEDTKVALGSSVRCALGGAADFKADCTREIGRGSDGEVWTVRHPDGSFRRFVLIDQGTRIASADGADEVIAQRNGADLEVRVASDRYLFRAAANAPAR